MSINVHIHAFEFNAVYTAAPIKQRSNHILRSVSKCVYKIFTINRKTDISWLHFPMLLYPIWILVPGGKFRPLISGGNIISL